MKAIAALILILVQLVQGTIFAGTSDGTFIDRARGLGRPSVIAAVGDVLLDRAVGDQIKKNGTDYPWEEVAPYLRGADLTIANLETSVSTRGKAEPGKTYTFRSRPETLDGLVNAGIDLVSIANNHTLDFGPVALQDTIDNLDQRGILHAGAGKNLDEAIAPTIIERNGQRIGFLAFNRVLPEGWAAGKNKPGVASGYDDKAILEAVRTLRARVDVVVVSMHWGIERELKFHKGQQQFGRALIDAGAYLVLGHHPHVTQGLEFYKKGLIAYSLGNFVFTSRDRLSTEAFMLFVAANKDGVGSVQIIPTLIVHGKPTVLGGKDRATVIERMRKLSVNTIIEDDGTVRPKD